MLSLCRASHIVVKLPPLTTVQLIEFTTILLVQLQRAMRVLESGRAQERGIPHAHRILELEAVMQTYQEFSQVFFLFRSSMPASALTGVLHACIRSTRFDCLINSFKTFSIADEATLIPLIGMLDESGTLDY